MVRLWVATTSHQRGPAREGPAVGAGTAPRPSRAAPAMTIKVSITSSFECSQVKSELERAVDLLVLHSDCTDEGTGSERRRAFPSHTARQRKGWSQKSGVLTP